MASARARPVVEKMEAGDVSPLSSIELRMTQPPWMLQLVYNNVKTAAANPVVARCFIPSFRLSSSPPVAGNNSLLQHPNSCPVNSSFPVRVFCVPNEEDAAATRTRASTQSVLVIVDRRHEQTANRRPARQQSFLNWSVPVSLIPSNSKGMPW